ncbi:hypothetical protein [Burkholderia cenocepacia]|uniref:hypothetical protein n=1 Tax=Burkholderia cenocepacia TaxID=95486 RepID=UPI001178AEF7|nr:hypothetical protein [Burkholderia cenocepacia]
MSRLVTLEMVRVYEDSHDAYSHDPDVDEFAEIRTNARIKEFVRRQLRADITKQRRKQQHAERVAKERKIVVI